MPQIHWSECRRYFYITQPGDRPTFWMCVDQWSARQAQQLRSRPFADQVRLTDTKSGRVYHRELLSFTFWSLKRGESAPISRHNDLYKDYAAAAQWKPEGRWWRAFVEHWNHAIHRITRLIERMRLRD